MGARSTNVYFCPNAKQYRPLPILRRNDNTLYLKSQVSRAFLALFVFGQALSQGFNLSFQGFYPDF